MVKLWQILGVGLLAGAALLYRKSAPATKAAPVSDAIIPGVTKITAAQATATDLLAQSASPFAPIPNNAATEKALGVLNPYEGGPQSIPNPEAATADYGPWGGTIAGGGALYALINNVYVRNPSADLIFDRGLGVYK